MSNYPDDISGRDLCYMEGCLGNGVCSRCGEVNYRLIGYYGAVARWAKAWGVSEDEAARRIEAHREERLARFEEKEAAQMQRIAEDEANQDNTWK